MESPHLAFTAFIHEKLNRSISAIEAVPTYSRSGLLTQTEIEWSLDNKKDTSFYP
jgi:hypothetical protein